jgi:hypothetical protein
MTRLALPGQQAIRDQIREPIYDTITLGAAENPSGQSYVFFENVQGKGKHLTNLRQPKILEGQVSFLIDKVSIEVQNHEAGNSKVSPIVIENSSCKLRIGEKDYWEGPMRFLTGGLYVEDADPTKHYSHSKSMASSCGLLLKGDDRLAIAPLQSFELQMNVATIAAAIQADATPVADSEVKFVAKLQGLKRRPVQ